MNYVGNRNQATRTCTDERIKVYFERSFFYLLTLTLFIWLCLLFLNHSIHHVQHSLCHSFFHSFILLSFFLSRHFHLSRLTSHLSHSISPKPSTPTISRRLRLFFLLFSSASLSHSFGQFSLCSSLLPPLFGVHVKWSLLIFSSTR